MCSEVNLSGPSDRLIPINAEHESRLGELREIHHLESASQSEQIDTLKTQLRESEKSVANELDQAHHRSEELKSLRKELDQTKLMAKEEEEKRTKAIGLLKSVRQKLVKVEKEKEDIMKEVEIYKSKEKDEQHNGDVDRRRWELQMQALRETNEKKLKEVLVISEKESVAKLATLKKEASAHRERLEADINQLKSEYSRMVDDQSAKIMNLESATQTISKERDELFDQLQMRTAELESSQSLLEVLESRTKELEFRLRESLDRISFLTEELQMSQNPSRTSRQTDNNASEDVTRLLLEVEGKYASRLSEARSRIKLLEKERSHAEEEWNRGINEKSKSLERLRVSLENKELELETLKNGQSDAGAINIKLELSINRLETTIQTQASEVEELRGQLGIASDKEIAVSQMLHDANERVDALDLQLEGAKERELQLKSSNKLIKDELRKVQSSVALLERQRNPGVGYWSTIGFDRPQSPKDAKRSVSIESSNGAAAFTQDTSEEEINYEYLRNVILQFLEHKDRRPNLVRVLSTILRFTPQETRRLMTKV